MSLEGVSINGYRTRLIGRWGRTYLAVKGMVVWGSRNEQVVVVVVVQWIFEEVCWMERLMV